MAKQSALREESKEKAIEKAEPKKVDELFIAKKKDEAAKEVDVGQSEFMKQWLMIPKSKRERLTKKQIAHFNKPDLATDALGMTEVRSTKKKGTLLIEDASQKKQDDWLNDIAKRPPASERVFKEDTAVQRPV